MQNEAIEDEEVESDTMTIEGAGRPLVRVEQGDRQQCQATHGHIQCPFRAIGTRRDNGTWDGPEYCPRHGGMALRSQRKVESRMYMLAKFQARVETIADHPKLKNLRDDIAILRMTLENKFSQIKDEADLEMRSGGVVDLINTIAKTVIICHKVERDSGQLLDKTQCLIWIQKVMGILSEHLTDQAILKNVGEDILLSLSTLFPE